MSNDRKLIHPDALATLKKLGYTQRQINYVASLVGRYKFCKENENPYRTLEAHAIVWFMYKAIGFTPEELINGLNDNIKRETSRRANRDRD